MSSAFGRTLLAATSLLGALSPVVAEAEGAAAKDQMGGIEEIVVTGSLIVRDGYEAPTSVTVVGVDQIQQSAPANIADSVNTLPAIAGGTSTHQASGGVSSA